MAQAGHTPPKGSMTAQPIMPAPPPCSGRHCSRSHEQAPPTPKPLTLNPLPGPGQPAPRRGPPRTAAPASRAASPGRPHHRWPQPPQRAGAPHPPPGWWLARGALLLRGAGCWRAPDSGSAGEGPNSAGCGASGVPMRWQPKRPCAGLQASLEVSLSECGGWGG